MTLNTAGGDDNRTEEQFVLLPKVMVDFVKILQLVNIMNSLHDGKYSLYLQPVNIMNSLHDDFEIPPKTLPFDCQEITSSRSGQPEQTGV